jgi:secretory phospholipase A2
MYLVKYSENLINISSFLFPGCKAAAKMLFTGTHTLGCKSYLDAQLNACYCPAGPGGSTTSNSKYPSGKSSDSSANNKKYDKKQQNKEKEKAPNYGWKTGNSEL